MTTDAFPSPAEIEACLLRDRDTFARRVRGLRSRARQGQPFDQGLIKLWAAVHESQGTLERRRACVPTTVHYPPELPVCERRGEIAALIAAHQVVLLCGETGSGKSTQLPKLCLDLGRGVIGRIGHTQPRRIAARTLASRVAQELKAELGGLVGYKVRFHDRVRPETAIKLMTDGMLLAEVQQDRLLLEYDTLIVDEAHERSLNIDFLLGYLHDLLPRRPDLKLIITSATIDPQRFSRHFGGAPVMAVSGRTYPVEVRYRPAEDENAGERDDAMQAAIVAAIDELSHLGRGDVLVFLSGEREIRETAETLRKHHPPSTEILPLFARQGPADQGRIFQSHASRRIVLATNVAETSLTVPGIHYVVDPGFARISRYSHRSKVQRLPVERISQASANQRKGRCGRVATGVCIRLYSEDNFGSRTEFTEPEIERTNLAAVILQMKLLGFGAIESFPFIDPPDGRLVADGYRTLEELGALDRRGTLTPLGQQLARLPVDPRIGRMLLAASEHSCLREVLIIAAALSVQDPRERPLDKQQAADEIHKTFAHPESDFLAFINLWRFLSEQREALSRAKFQKLCRGHFLSWNRVQEWIDIHQQLTLQLHEMGLKENTTAADYEAVHRALLTGLLVNVGFKDEGREYLGARGGRFVIHPGSGLTDKGPKWLVAAERVETTRQYGRTVARVQPGWIEDAGAHLVQRSWSEPHWQAHTGQVAAFERVTLFGLTLAAQRRVNFGPINPAEAREVFLRAALVGGDFETRAPFWRHNQELIATLQHLETKSRRRDILVDEEAIYAFYAERIPEGIYASAAFDKWLRLATRTTPKLLHMRMEDLMRREAAEVTRERFPDTLQVGASALPLEYHFDPGHIADGVTLVVPLPLINQVSPDRGDWLVPGLLEERIVALLRGLPKAWRKVMVPVPDTAARVVARLTPSDRPLVQAVAEAIKALTGVQIPEDAWDPTAIPAHLHMKYRLVDTDGAKVAEGDNLIALKRLYGETGQDAFTRVPSAGLEREGITRWDFGDLPEAVDLERGGIKLRGYPALVDRGDSVSIQVLDSAEGATLAGRAGLRRLFGLALGADLKRLRQGLPALQRMTLQYAKAAPLPPGAKADLAADLAGEVMTLILDRTFTQDQPPIRDQIAFTARLAAQRGRLPAVAAETAQLVARVLSQYQDLRQRLVQTTQAHWLATAADIRAQLDGLVYRGFLGQVPYSRLKDYPRYLSAAAQRLDRLAQGAVRDRERMQEIAPLLLRWGERASAMRAAGRRDPRLEEIRWMLEELRVSLFAQQLGTAYPVSVKRVEARWRELGL